MCSGGGTARGGVPTFRGCCLQAALLLRPLKVYLEPQSFPTHLSGQGPASPSKELSLGEPLDSVPCHGGGQRGQPWGLAGWEGLSPPPGGAEGLCCESSDRMTGQSKRRVENKIDVTLYCKF